jgi:RNA polymerase sigma-70 factor (ECF subfamily)
MISPSRINFVESKPFHDRKPPGDPPHNESTDLFPASRWTLVRKVQSEADSAFEALGELCQLYWYPIYAYIRRSGRTPETSEDLTQGYFQSLLDRHYLELASPEKGKLRAFLLADVKLYLSNERRRDGAEKRGGGRIHVPIDRDAAEDSYRFEPSTDVSPADLFDRRWALTLLARVLERVRADYREKGREDLFEALRQFISWNAGDDSYAEVAARIGRDQNYVKQNVLRMRKRYRAFLEEEVGHTVGSPDEVAAEIRHLAASLC